MRILGIDPGSVTTGFGVIEQTRGGKFELVELGCIRCARGADLSTRLHSIYESLGSLIRRTQPDCAAVESPFHGLNSRSLIQLSHARGVILLAVKAAGLSVFEYAPRSVKSAVVGYGAAEKQQVEKMVRLLLGNANAEKMQSDAADALAVAICHANSSKMLAIRAAVAR